MPTNCIPFSAIKNKDLPLVGGKNASLGEMLATLAPLGIKIPDGFAVTAAAYRTFIKENQLKEKLEAELATLDNETLDNLSTIGANCREILSSGKIPKEIEKDIAASFEALRSGNEISVAVRSSATAEDLPTASFAGQHDSFLNIVGLDNLLKAVHRCYISLFNDRAIKYRIDNGFDHMDVALSVGVQHMVRSDKGSAGVIFTIDPETGFQNVIYITAAWGLGENVVQGAVNPDEFFVFKPSLENQKKSIIYRKLGEKENKMVYAVGSEKPIINVTTSPTERSVFCLSDQDVQTLAEWSFGIEKHYQMAMDIEWAKDGLSGELFIVQARPETVHGKRDALSIKEYTLKTKATPICKGKAVGRSIASGRACIVQSLADAGKVQKGDIIVADITNPDWNAMLRKAVCIITNKGGRTSHASIVARELGIHAVVGTSDATEKLHDWSSHHGLPVLKGLKAWFMKKRWNGRKRNINIQYKCRETRTRPQCSYWLNPRKRLSLSFFIPIRALAFYVWNSSSPIAIRIHPMALRQIPLKSVDSNDK